MYAYQRDHAARFKGITLESRGVLAETGTLRDDALAMLGGGQANV